MEEGRYNLDKNHVIASLMFQMVYIYIDDTTDNLIGTN